MAVSGVRVGSASPPRHQCPRDPFALAFLASVVGFLSGSASSCGGGPGQPSNPPPERVYYVDAVSGDDDRQGTSPAAAWRSLGRANEALFPGDTVVIAAGVYPPPIQPARSGEPGRRITYRAAPGAVAVVEGDGLLLDLAGRSYVTVEGLRFRNPGEAWGRLDRAQQNEIARNLFVAEGRTDAHAGLELRRAAYNRVVENEFRDWGDALSSWGDAVRLTDGSDHNLVEGNRFVNAGHSLLAIESSFNVVTGNRFENAWQKGLDLVWRVNPPWAPGEELVARRNVIEGNHFLRCRMSADGETGGVGIQIAAAETIFRGNILVGNDRAGVLLNGWSDAPRAYGNRLYHNTLVDNGAVAAPIRSGIAVTQWGNVAVDVRANRFENNVLDNSGAPHQLVVDLSPKADYGAAFLASYRIAGNCVGPRSTITIESLDGPQTLERYEEHYPQIVTGNRRAPIHFADAAAGDYRLAAGSGCIDAAAPLTTTTSAGSGRVVAVVDASYFSAGFGVVPGDTVTIVGSGAAELADVDYERNLLTLSRDIQWQAGSSVFWRQYAGARPDAGALEYGQ